MTKPVCKYHDVYCGISESETLLLDKDPTDARVIQVELDIISKALERIGKKLKMTLRTWPVCNNQNGQVYLSHYFVDRSKKLVHGYWACNCQYVEDDEKNEWDEDTLELDS